MESYKTPDATQIITPNTSIEGKHFTIEEKVFNEKNNTFLLNVKKEDINFDNIRKLAKEKGFEEKNEFHITVLSFKNGNEIKKILKTLSPEDQQLKTEEIKNLINNTNWDFTPEELNYRIQKEYKSQDPNNKELEIIETRESYIKKIKMFSLQEFYKNLNTILGSDLQIPPPHITLFTNGTDKEKSKMGIGINSEEELSQLNPELILPDNESVETSKDVINKAKANEEQIDNLREDILNTMESTISKNETIDIDKEATSFIKEIEDYTDEHSEYMMGYSFENLIDEIVENLSEKYKIEFDPNIVSSKEDTKYGEKDGSDEGTTNGEVFLMNEKIFEYTSYSDGYDASIKNWNPENLKKALINLLINNKK